MDGFWDWNLTSAVRSRRRLPNYIARPEIFQTYQLLAISNICSRPLTANTGYCLSYSNANCKDAGYCLSNSNAEWQDTSYCLSHSMLTARTPVTACDSNADCQNTCCCLYDRRSCDIVSLALACNVRILMKFDSNNWSKETYIFETCTNHSSHFTWNLK